jgi:putative DNA primase/helicase
MAEASAPSAEIIGAVDADFKNLREKLEDGKPVYVGSQNAKHVSERFLAACGHHVVRYHRENWYEYLPDSGHYVELDKEILSANVLQFMQGLYDEQTATVREHFDAALHKLIRPRPIKGPAIADVVTALKAATIVEPLDLPLWLGEGTPGRMLCLKNGLIDLDMLITTGKTKLRRHTPDFFSIVALPFDYDPDASCPRWDAFLQQMLDGDAERIAVLQEFFGFCLGPAVKLHKFLLMEGGGSNGKTTAVNVLRDMLGEPNVSHLPLESFADKFQLISTYGKLLNIAPEALKLDRKTESRVKAFVGGDSVSDDRKNKSRLTWEPTTRLVVVCNERPKVSDRSDGFWRRMMVMPFKVIAVDPKDASLYPTAPVKDPDLPAKLKAELAGVFNWSIAGLRRLLKAKQFTASAVMAATLETAKADDNPIRRFAMAYLKPSPNAHTSKQDVYGLYRIWCEKQGEVAENHVSFGRALRQVIAVEDGRNRVNGDRVETYKGVRMLRIV